MWDSTVSGAAHLTGAKHKDDISEECFAAFVKNAHVSAAIANNDEFKMNKYNTALSCELTFFGTYTR